MRLALRAPLAEPERRALEAELAPLHMLDQVIRWSFSRTPPRDVTEVVIQDEFTHDVVIPWRDALHLVFDTT